MCVAVAKTQGFNLCYASSPPVLEYLTLLNTKGVGWKHFASFIRGAQLFNMIKESNAETKRNATACSRRNDRRKVVTKEILNRISRFKIFFDILRRFNG